MKTWFTVDNKAATPTVSIFDEIGMWGVTAKSFHDEFKNITGNEVLVDINSPGGDVFTGFAIYNMLRTSGKKVRVRVQGVAASIASIIAMAGDEIEMPENSYMMVHDPAGGKYGSASALRAHADLLDKVRASLVSTYQKRTNRTADEISAMLDAETWMTAQEAVDAGFATRVTEAASATASFDVDRLPENVRAAYNLASSPEAATVDAPPPDAGAPDAGGAAPVGEGSPESDETTQEDPPEAPDAGSGADQEPSGAPSLTAAVAAATSAAGLDAFAALWAADLAITSTKDIAARVSAALEIKALFALAKLGGADTLIRENKTVAEARAYLFEALQDATPEVDTAPRNRHDTQGKNAPPTAVNTSKVWEARNKQTGAIK